MKNKPKKSKKMANEYVVYRPSDEKYLISYDEDETSQEDPKPIINEVWGEAQEALIFGTLNEAQSLAGRIGGGTVGTTKP